MMEQLKDKLSKANSSTILVPAPSSIAAAVTQLSPKYPNTTALVEALARAHISAAKAVTPLNTLAGAVTLNSLLSTTGNASCGTSFTLTPKAAGDVNTDADLYPTISADGGKTQVKSIWYNRIANVSGSGYAALYLIESPLVPCNFDALYKRVQQGCNPCDGDVGSSDKNGAFALIQLPATLLLLCSVLLAYIL